jgi:ATP synthase protein I
MAADLHKRPSARFDSAASPPVYSARSMAGRPNRGNSENLWGGMSTGIQITAYLLAGLFVWGGVGYLIDWLVGTAKVFTAVGMIVGAAAGVYVVYLRYGRDDGTKR